MTTNLSLMSTWKAHNVSKTRITADKFCEKYNLKDLDFLKIDTDHNEYNILGSAQHIIESSPVLGLNIEVSFYGDHNMKNSFAHIDIRMKEYGFVLVDLHLKHYSTSTLPRPFLWECVAETIEGRLYQGDALYLRDPLGMDVVGAPRCPKLSIDKLLKLICLYEIYDKPDMSAELLMAYRNELSTVIDVDENLNLLTREVLGRDITYTDYIDCLRAEDLFPNGKYGINSVK